MMEKDQIKDVIGQFKEDYSEWTDWYTECEKDDRFALGDQWEDADRQKLQNEGRPDLSLNMLHKPISLLTGYERQNRTDLRVQPIEGADQPMADVFSEVLKWCMSERSQDNKISIAFHDAVTCGIGWINPTMCYDEDFISGDIRITAENKYRIIPDPEMTEQDLSDCSRIFRHAWIHKDKAKQLYPDKKDEIDALKEGDTSNFTIQQPLTSSNKTHISIIEKWYREYEMKKYLFDGVNIVPVDKGGAARAQELIRTVPEYAHMEIISRKVPVIKLLSVAGSDIVLYDDVNPDKVNMYPFIPVFGHYYPHFNDWKWKLFGLVRPLRDVQREKNKRRSQLLHAALTVPFSGFMYEEGAVDDPSVFNTSSGAGKVIKINDINKVKQITAQEIPSALVQLERMNDNDFVQMSVNPDLLGAVGQGASGASAPGVSLQLRQRQGLIAVQSFFDNMSLAKKMLGKYMIELIIENFTEDKIQRILGDSVQVPQGFKEMARNARFDCVIDEVVNSPTYRMNNFSILATLMQNGFPVQPETLVKWSDFPQGLKDDLKGDIGVMRGTQAPGGGQVPMPQPEYSDVPISANPIDAGPMSDVPMGAPRKGVDIGSYNTVIGGEY